MELSPCKAVPRNSWDFMKPKGSLPYLQKPVAVHILTLCFSKENVNVLTIWVTISHALLRSAILTEILCTLYCTALHSCWLCELSETSLRVRHTLNRQSCGRKVECILHDLWCGMIGPCRTLRIEYSNVLIITVPLTDENAPSKIV
jgi:hypothetical protein